MKHITQLNVFFDKEPLGRLSYHNRQWWFQYDPHWLENGFNLAPQLLSFDFTPQLAKLPIFEGLHGIFYDSLPDGWGMLLMDRFFKGHYGWHRHEITPADRLAYLGSRAMGALEYEPVLAESKLTNEKVNLFQLSQAAEQVMQGSPQQIMDQLRILGGSPGGARPKVAVGLAEASDECITGREKLPAGFHHWLVKFHGQEDTQDIAHVEQSYVELAALAGLLVPPTRLIHLPKHTFFASKRFDRNGEKKLHMLTLSGYLYADHRLPALDYSALIASTAILTRDIRQIQQAFRRMVFNIAVHNKDDHAKNFAFIADRTGKWSLAPAYDLTFSSGMNNEHTTAINGAGNPTRQDIAKVAAEHGILPWEQIVAEVLAAVEQWPSVANKNKVNKGNVKKIATMMAQVRKCIE